MRPIWAVGVSVAAVAAFWWLRWVVDGWDVMLLIVGVQQLAQLVPVVMALCLLGRERLGRWTSVCFVVQAGLLALESLVMTANVPDGANPEWPPVVVLLGLRSVSSQTVGGLALVSVAAFALWLLLIPVTGVCAWWFERKPVGAGAR
ncbi:hypothetical protein [Kutzneria sp. CA-103260]|uniref:hypothetical protein n=1 Tax=Kutzneria sp. CA-103260 TaxID=2802641 RepID=UPI001BAABD33|nr:hypothetical protein [Kutzneria sp. CA-103260]QUQ64929.1 hypothetical protein JJ691_26500 [Kutzneria sp. CA-103260]